MIYILDIFIFIKNDYILPQIQNYFVLIANCELLWQSERIAVDGVIVENISENCIIVSCEIDPPDHWVQCQLSAYNGKKMG